MFGYEDSFVSHTRKPLHRVISRPHPTTSGQIEENEDHLIIYKLDNRPIKGVVVNRCQASGMRLLLPRSDLEDKRG